jgi:competence protein ComEA
MNDNPQPEPAPRNTIIAFIIVIAALIGGGVLLLATRPQPVHITINPPLPTATREPTPTQAPVTVYVTGAVAAPEKLYTLPPGSRVQDAIKAAGGAKDTADLTKVNQAVVVRDGDQIHVPEQGEEISLATPSGGQIVHINTATVEELDNLPGVGPSLAEKIIEYRKANGAFKSLDDLDAVSGIGPALLEKIAPLIAFD